MEHGVRNSRMFLAIVTGPFMDIVAAPPTETLDDAPAINAYFRRPYCLKELGWAVDAGKMIQPIVRNEDKGNVGALMKDAPPDLKFLGGVDL